MSQEQKWPCASHRGEDTQGKKAKNWPLFFKKDLNGCENENMNFSKFLNWASPQALFTLFLCYELYYVQF